MTHNDHHHHHRRLLIEFIISFAFIDNKCSQSKSWRCLSILQVPERTSPNISNGYQSYWKRYLINWILFDSLCWIWIHDMINFGLYRESCWSLDSFLCSVVLGRNFSKHGYLVTVQPQTINIDNGEIRIYRLLKLDSNYF